MMPPDDPVTLPDPQKKPCEHAGRVRPVVWEVAGLMEIPSTVVCERCWKVIGTNAVAHPNYKETEDGWFMPWPADEA